MLLTVQLVRRMMDCQQAHRHCRWRGSLRNDRREHSNRDSLSPTPCWRQPKTEARIWIGADTRIELGHMVDRVQWRQGYAQEALVDLSSTLIGPLGVRSV